TDLTSTFIVPSAPLAFFSTDTAPPDIYTLSLHDALPICNRGVRLSRGGLPAAAQTAEQVQLPHRAQTCIVDRLVTVETGQGAGRSEEHTSELQSPYDLVCRLLLEKKKKKKQKTH